MGRDGRALFVIICVNVLLLFCCEYMSILEQLYDLEEEFRGKNFEDIDLQVKILKLIRENNMLRPRLVIACGDIFVYYDKKNHTKAKTSVSQIELFEICHQVFHSALVLHDEDLADTCYERVVEKFGEKSTRVRLMLGLRYESQGRYIAAKDIYQKVIDDDTNLVGVKRLSALQKAEGNLKSAIETLTRMVDSVYFADLECFMELADLYIEVNDYSSAMYCLEECLMKDPKNYFFYLRCGDVSYSIGDYKSARKYYSKCLELNKDCMRANFGLVLAIKYGKGNKLTQELNKELDRNMQRHYLGKNADGEIIQELKVFFKK